MGNIFSKPVKKMNTYEMTEEDEYESMMNAKEGGKDIIPDVRKFPPPLYEPPEEVDDGGADDEMSSDITSDITAEEEDQLEEEREKKRRKEMREKEEEEEEEEEEKKEEMEELQEMGATVQEMGATAMEPPVDKLSLVYNECRVYREQEKKRKRAEKWELDQEKRKALRELKFKLLNESYRKLTKIEGNDLELLKMLQICQVIEKLKKL